MGVLRRSRSSRTWILTGKKLAPIVADGRGWTTSLAGEERRIADEVSGQLPAA